MLEYIRFGLFVVLLLSGLIIEITAMVGVNRFRFSMNRAHAAGMGDTLGLLLVALAAAVYLGFSDVVLKIALIVAFFYLTSPVCSHLIGRLIRETDERFQAEAKEWKR